MRRTSHVISAALLVVGAIPTILGLLYLLLRLFRSTEAGLGWPACFGLLGCGLFGLWLGATLWNLSVIADAVGKIAVPETKERLAA